MKKNLPYIIIIVLLVIIAIGGTYLVMKKDYSSPSVPNLNEFDSSSNEKEEMKNKSGVELISTKEENSNIVQTFNAYMNDKIIPIKITYTYGEDAYYEGQTNDYEFTKGVIGTTLVYWHPLELKETSKKSNIFNIPTIKKNFTTNNFRIIKGADNKDYLVVVTYNYDLPAENGSAFATRDDILYVFNDELLPIKLEDSSSNCNSSEGNGLTAFNRHGSVTVQENPWYSNSFNLITSGKPIQVKVEENKIFYLTSVYKNGDLNQGTLEERVYTINNNQSSYEVKNTYKIIESVGGTC